MKKITRLIAQLILWGVVWLVMWQGEDIASPFLRENLPAYIMQFVVLSLLVYVIAPKVLFKKKYFLFFGITVGILLLTAYLSSIVVVAPNLDRMPPPPGRGGFPQFHEPPSQFFIHSLMIAIAYSIATSIELFIYVNEKEKETIKRKNESLQTELKLLKSQINPHFLFNALNNIYSMSIMQSSKTSESILDLSNMLRYVLYECEQPEVFLEKEIAYIKDYIRLFTLKSSREFDIKLDINIQNHNLKIAPMILIPFIENAFKHGNIEARAGSYIIIEINSESNKINFKVENSLPKSPKQKDSVGGIGLVNVKKRLNILYPNTHELKIEATNSSYSVQLNIEVHENN